MRKVGMYAFSTKLPSQKLCLAHYEALSGRVMAWLKDKGELHQEGERLSLRMKKSDRVGELTIDEQVV